MAARQRHALRDRHGADRRRRRIGRGHLAALLGASNGVALLQGDGANPDQSSVIQAVVDIDGAVSFPDAALIEMEEKAQGATVAFLGGSYSERGLVWHEASPITYVGPRSAPTLFSTAPRHSDPAGRRR